MKPPLLQIHLILIAFTLVFPATDISAGQAKITGNGVHVRSAPSMKGSILGKLYKEDKVNTVGKSGSWTKVDLPDISSSLWVSRSYVKDGKITASNLHVRTGPGTWGDSLGLIAKGTKVEIEGRYRNWYKISPPKGLTAWVASAYVTQAKEKPKPKTEVKKKPEQTKPKPKPAKKMTEAPNKKPEKPKEVTKAKPAPKKKVEEKKPETSPPPAPLVTAAKASNPPTESKPKPKEKSAPKPTAATPPKETPAPKIATAPKIKPAPKKAESEDDVLTKLAKDKKIQKIVKEVPPPPKVEKAVSKPSTKESASTVKTEESTDEETVEAAEEPEEKPAAATKKPGLWQKIKGLFKK